MKGFIPTQELEIHGRRIEYAVSGTGSPPIILINGSGGHLDSWFRIFDRLSSRTTTIAYNRSGVGETTSTGSKQTVSECGSELLNLLEGFGIAAPWILVGHSFGGLVANYLARQVPTRIAGVVLLDATAPEDVAASEVALRATGLLSRISAALAPGTAHSEVQYSAESVREIASAGPFPPVPLTVITGGRSAKGWTVPRGFQMARARNQQSLATLSPMGKQVVAERSGHFPQMNEPDLVVEAIFDLMSQACVGSEA